ncbi:hypothetical protein FRC02_009644 [Tulasnella sp. 418]|nr:hypothetical protein FRC02_009644 [Tulasnella sp. 418]
MPPSRDQKILGSGQNWRRSQLWNREFYQQLSASSQLTPPNRPKARNVEYTTKDSYIGGLPMDIWHIILRMIRPVDIVACMYAYDNVHEYLCSSKDECARLWHTIFAGDKMLPSGPEHLTPGQYAEFVLGNRCSACLGQHRKLRTHYAIFTRLCPGCYELEVVTANWILNNLVEPGENFPTKASVLYNDSIACPGRASTVRGYSLTHANIVLQRYRDLYHIDPTIKVPGDSRNRHTAESHTQVVQTKIIAGKVRRYMEHNAKLSEEDYKQSARYQEIIRRLEQQPECWTPVELPKNNPRWQSWMSRKGNLTEKGGIIYIIRED